MRIVDCTTFVIANPPPHFGGRYFIVVKLTTDTGIVGYGEVYVATFGPHTVAAMIADVADRWVIDADPNRIESLWRRMYSSGYSLRPDPTLVGVMSGIEMACWDIVGKDAGKPVYDLLGGRVHERIRTYTYLYPSDGRPDVYSEPSQAAEQAAFEVERGFTALKFDPRGRTRRSTGISRAWRTSIGRWRSPRRSARRWDRVPICCSAPTASSPRRGRSDWHSAWSGSTRCGSRNRRNRTSPRRWLEWLGRRRFRSLPANG
jgi:L-alanine-DL-glutamate epimerase-like enolase superfamily enzyme